MSPIATNTKPEAQQPQKGGFAKAKYSTQEIMDLEHDYSACVLVLMPLVFPLRLEGDWREMALTSDGTADTTITLCLCALTVAKEQEYGIQREMSTWTSWRRIRGSFPSCFTPSLQMSGRYQFPPHSGDSCWTFCTDTYPRTLAERSTKATATPASSRPSPPRPRASPSPPVPSTLLASDHSPRNSPRSSGTTWFSP